MSHHDPTFAVLFQEHREGHEGAPGDSEDCGDQSDAELQSGNGTDWRLWLVYAEVDLGGRQYKP